MPSIYLKRETKHHLSNYLNLTVETCVIDTNTAGCFALQNVGKIRKICLCHDSTKRQDFMS